MAGCWDANGRRIGPQPGNDGQAHGHFGGPFHRLSDRTDFYGYASPRSPPSPSPTAFLAQKDREHRDKVAAKSTERIARLDALARDFLPKPGRRVEGTPNSDAFLRSIEDEYRARDAPRRQEQARARQELDEATRRRNAFKAEFEGLPPEPDAGTTIQAMMPDGKRLVRTFEQDALGRTLYVWIAGQTLTAAKKLFPSDIVLSTPFGNVPIRPDVGLRRQGIVGRTIVMVSTID